MPPSSPAASPLSICLQLTRAISGTAQLDHIFEAALQALEQGLGVARGSILLCDPDGVMRFKAWRGLSDVYRTAMGGHTRWPAHARGSRPIVVSDVTPWRS